MPARPTPRALALTAALLAAGCDFSPALDIETPAHAPAVVLRAVLATGAPATVRVSVSRDPYGPPERDRPPTATPPDAVVLLLRDGHVVETLAVRPQTCYGYRQATCNLETGRTDVQQAEPYECGAFVGTAPVEAGATYTVRAELTGLPPAEATVEVPAPPTFTVEEEVSADPETRRFRVHLTDLPAPDTRYGLALHREFDRYTASVCAPGGYRDTTIVLGTPARYQTRYTTTDPVLLAGAREPSGSGYFFTFTDATFDGGAYTFAVEAPATDVTSTTGGTGRFTAQLAVLSPVLYDAYQLVYFALGDDNPFAEPINLPSNVVGGYGRVGAVTVGEVLLPAPLP